MGATAKITVLPTICLITGDLRIVTAPVDEALAAGDAHPAKPGDPIVNRRSNRRCGRYASTQDHRLRHDRQREIVPIATFVAGLEIVATNRKNDAIGKVAKRARDRVGRGIADQG